MAHGRGGLEYWDRMVFVLIEYRSSVLRRSPSMSNRHARIGGKLVVISGSNGEMGELYSVLGFEVILRFLYPYLDIKVFGDEVV